MNEKERSMTSRVTWLTPFLAFILWGATSGPWGRVSIGLFDLRAAFAGFALTGIFVIWVHQIARWIRDGG